MTLEELWEKRLDNWALWFVSGGATASVSGAYGFIGGGSGQGQSSGIPAMVGEALDTDALVVRLEPSLQQAVRVWYCWTGTAEAKARDLGVHRDTLADRVRRAKIVLDDLHRKRRREINAFRTPQKRV